MRGINNCCRLVVGLSLVFSLASITAAQSGRGSLAGLVCSRVGNAGLENAKIEIQSIKTIARKDESASTVTDQYGRYEMLQVTMGSID